MAILQINDHPTLGPNDQLVIQFRDYESRARLFVKSRSASAVVTVKSGINLSDIASSATATLTLPGLGVVQELSLPVQDPYPAGTPASIDRVTVVSVTSGLVEATVISPSEFNSYLTVQTT